VHLDAKEGAIADLPEECVVPEDRSGGGRAAERPPDEVVALAVLGGQIELNPSKHCVVHRGQAVEAVPHLRKWVEKHPDGTDERLALAQACMGAKQWTNAIQEFSTVLASSAEARAQVLLDRAQCQQQAGDSATNILKGLDEGIARIGPIPQLVRHAAEVELLRGAVEAAVARIGVLAERSERTERWLFEQGELFRRGGRLEDAQRCYSNAIVVLESLPPKFQRSLLSVELRRELEARLVSGGVR
jgi:tetratricopeptide (TPR) repeat protein